MEKQKTVIVGMSGGVDSSVSALLLKKQGYNVIGMFMKNWEEKDENGVCQSAKEYADVVKVCEKLDIPYYSVDFVNEYRDNVFSYFLDEYKKGNTPNPDILCNREIKFKVFYEKAMQLGADYLATGHYCQKIETSIGTSLVKGKDNNKDQTYFLYTMKEDVLKNVLFPIGHLEKSEVRELAKEYDLVTHNKKDSTGICFIGERNFKNFLSQYIKSGHGEFQTLSGETVGKHSGVSFYTVGQRKGLGLGGPGEPWFVVGKNVSDNVVYVERGELHPALFTDHLYATDLSLVNGEKLEIGKKLMSKVRYRQKDQECFVESYHDGVYKISFTKPQRAIATRQSIVFYDNIDGNEVCLGGAIIERPGQSFYERDIVVDQKESHFTIG